MPRSIHFALLRTTWRKCPLLENSRRNGRCLARGLFEGERFLAGVVCADEDGYENDGGADFDENFAAVEPVDGMMLEVGVGEEGVPEEGYGAEVNGEVEGFPEAAADLDAEVGGDDHEGEDVEGDGADGVFERLLRRVDGIDDVENVEFWRIVEEQDDGMESRKG